MVAWWPMGTPCAGRVDFAYAVLVVRACAYAQASHGQAHGHGRAAAAGAGNVGTGCVWVLLVVSRRDVSCALLCAWRVLATSRGLGTVRVEPSRAARPVGVGERRAGHRPTGGMRIVRHMLAGIVAARVYSERG